MAELPGWDRARLRTADPKDVAAARWHVFAQRMDPMLKIDVEARLTEIAILEASPASAKRMADQQRAEARESLQQLRIRQAEARTALLLDEDDDG